jgi:PII-like signaling protein
MKSSGKAKLLRIFCGSDDKVNHTPLYEFIVYEAKKYGLAGATVFRGVMGYGANSVVHSTKILAISDDLPVVIEIADDNEKIDAFLIFMEQYFENSTFGLLITAENVDVIRYAPAKK